MRKLRNPLWSHAEHLGNGKFICNYCKRRFSGGASRIRFHLSGLRGNDIVVCTQVPSDLQEQICRDINEEYNKKRKFGQYMEEISCGMSASSVNVMEGMSFQPSSTDGDSRQTTMPETVKKMDKSEVDELLATFFIQNNVAFNVMQQKSFIDLIKGVVEYGPAYKLPSYSTLKTKAKGQVDEYVENVKKSWEKTGCTIMCDTWSDTKGRCFINFIAHSPKGSVFLQSVEISEERRTDDFLKELLSRVIDMVGSQHVVQFITDNALNFESAGDMLVGKYPTMYKTKCAAHSIQLLLKDIYEDVPWVQSVVDNAKVIQSYMYCHSTVTALMREATNGRELRKPCSTRFASHFLVLQSILALENELKLFVSSSGWSDLSYSLSQDGKLVTELIQGSSFWSQGREVIQLLEPLICILRLIDSERSTTGYLFQAMEIVKDGLKIKAAQDGDKYGHILTLFDRRRKDNIIHPIHAFAATLDPSYMTSPNFKQTWEMKEGLYYLFGHVVHVDEKDQFMKEYRDYCMKLPLLFNPATYSMMKTYHPRLWWEFNGDLLPVLQKYAMRILSQPCSSSSCVHKWSAFEVAQTKKRNRGTPDMLGLLVYCQMNAMMLRNFEDKGLKDVDPVDLSKLDEWPNYGEEVESYPPRVCEIEETISSSLDDTNLGVNASATSSILTMLTNVCVTYINDEDEAGDHVADYGD